MTPERLLAHPLGPVSGEWLYEYATCEELVRGDESLCPYFPGGAKFARKGEAPLTFTFVDKDGKEKPTYEYGVCTSRAAGYLLIKGLVAGVPKKALLPYAKRMLYGVQGVTPEALVDDASAVYKEGRVDAAPDRALAAQGFFHHLAGAAACASVPGDTLRRECARKAAAVRALKKGDASLCAAGDLMCRALVDGPRDCAEPGRQAVAAFCRSYFAAPRTDDETRRVFKEL